jgi:hypothetical protein
MKGTRLLSVSIALAALLALAVGLSAAQGPIFQERDRPQTTVGETTTAPSAGEPAAALGTGFIYQGQLLDNSTPVNDTCNLQFSLYDDPFTGTLVAGPQDLTGVSVVAGRFTVLLDFGAIFQGEAYWLEFAVKCSGDADYTIMDPRHGLTAAPYALSLQPGAVISGTVAGSVLTARNQSEYGIAIVGVQSDYDPYDMSSFWEPGGFFGGRNGVIAYSKEPSGYGVLGYSSASSGNGHGVHGVSESPLGAGLYGWNTATSGGFGYGVYGKSDATNGIGVYGYAGGSGDGHGVHGVSESSNGAGVYGWNLSDDYPATGVYGGTGADGGHGVEGFALSGIGVYGLSAGGGLPAGVYGQSDATNGIGLYGYVGATTGGTFGVYGIVYSDSGRGVYGRSYASTGTTMGVFGAADSPNGWGVYYSGGLGGTGLQTTIVETPSHGWRNLYNGASTTPLFEDLGSAQLVDGRAEVAIDPIFAQTVNLSADYYVFTTALSDEPVLLYVTEKNAASFILQGVTLDGRPAQCAVDYRIVARRPGYEDVRMSPATVPTLPEVGLPGGE